MAVVTKPAGKPKAATGKPVAKKASNREEFRVHVTAPGFVTIEGIVDHISGDMKNGGILKLRHKKPRSSLWVVTPISLKTVRMVRGTLGKGKKVQIGYLSPNHIHLELREADIETVDSDTGLVKGTDKAGIPFLIHEDNLKAVTTSEVTAPALKDG